MAIIKIKPLYYLAQSDERKDKLGHQLHWQIDQPNSKGTLVI
jgi:hypothetical protein